jgi:hypothetical protein
VELGALMRLVRTQLVVAALVFAAIGTACGSNQSTSPTSPSGVTPRVTSVTPAQILQSDAPQSITVNGLNFITGLQATLTDPAGNTRSFAGGDIQAIQTNSFQITATFAVAGSYTLQVKESTGTVSDPFAFAVQSLAGSTTPQISSINPGSTLHNGNPQFLTINGAQFAPSLTVTLIDPTGQPTQLIGAIVGIVTPTQFQVLVTLTRVGTYSLFVTNPSGEISNTVSLPVQ